MARSQKLPVKEVNPWYRAAQMEIPGSKRDKNLLDLRIKK
jgi:hypothetical protein